MKKLKQDLIEKLRNGEIAVKNSGTLKQLREVLKKAFPKDAFTATGQCNFYYKERLNNGTWDCDNETTLTTLHVKDFFEEEFFNGEEIEYIHSSYSWNTGLYIGRHPKEDGLHAVVGLGYNVMLVDKIRKKTTEEPTPKQQATEIVEQLNELIKRM